jgi:bacillithiol biosynthesis cysteine-adding enzyme BshC
MQDDPAVKPLFEFRFGSEVERERRAAWLSGSDQPRADRRSVIEALVGFNRHVDNSQRALDNVNRLADPNALVVVGGQQAGLFTGPLLVLYKAVTIIREAREAELALGRPVVPIFWIAGEDHDYEEANHTYVLTREQQIEKIKLNPRDASRTSISRLVIDAGEWEQAIGQLAEGMMATEFTPGLLDRLREIGSRSATLVEFFGRVMAWLFGEDGLVLLDSDDAKLRECEAPMFRRLIERNEALNEALISGRDKVEAIGLAPQHEVQAGQANLFVHAGEERMLLQREGEHFQDRKGVLSLTRDQLLKWADEQPALLSNNVMTRPLMQEFLFPVLATVLGAGEIAYWGLTGEAFAEFGMKMPILMPRLEVTLVEGTLQKHMRKYELDLADVFDEFERKKQAWLDRQDSLQLEDKFAAVKRQFAEMYQPLLDAIAGLNPGMKKLGETNRQKILEQIDFMAGKATDAYQSQFEAALRQMDRIKLSLHPHGKPQERVYNAFTYLNKYGEGWLRELVETKEPLTAGHYICYF